MAVTVPEWTVQANSQSASLPGTPVAGDVVVYVVSSARNPPRNVTAVDGLGAPWTDLGGTARAHWYLCAAPAAGGSIIATFDGGTAIPACAAWRIRGLTSTEVRALTVVENAATTALTGPTHAAALQQIVMAIARGATNPVTLSTFVPATGWTSTVPGSAGGAYRIPGSSASHRVDATNGTSGLMVISQLVMGPVPAPDVPTGLAQTGATFATIDADWTAPVGGEAPTSYEYRVNGGAPVSVGLATAATITGLTPGTTYLVEVRSVGAGGPSAWATGVNMSTDPLLAPTGLLVTNATDSSLTITWTPPVGDAPDSYEYRLDGGAPGAAGSDTTHVISGLSSSTTYSIEVRSVAEGFFSAWSSSAEGMTLAPPASVSSCFTSVRGSGLRITALTAKGRIPEVVSYATSKSVVKVSVREVIYGGNSETLKNTENERRLKIIRPADSIRNLVDIEFIRVDPGVLSLIAGVPLTYNAAGNIVGFDSDLNASPASFALEVWTKLAGLLCTDGSQTYGYTLFPYLRGGRISGFAFTNGRVSFNLIGAQTRRSGRWGVGPHDLEGPFERLASLVSRNTKWSMFTTPAAPPLEVCGVREFTPAVLDNGTAANPMPNPDAPLTVDGGGAVTSAWIIEGGRA